MRPVSSALTKKTVRKLPADQLQCRLNRLVAKCLVVERSLKGASQAMGPEGRVGGRAAQYTTVPSLTSGSDAPRLRAVPGG